MGGLIEAGRHSGALKFVSRVRSSSCNFLAFPLAAEWVSATTNYNRPTCRLAMPSVDANGNPLAYTSLSENLQAQGWDRFRIDRGMRDRPPSSEA